MLSKDPEVYESWLGDSLIVESIYNTESAAGRPGRARWHPEEPRTRTDVVAEPSKLQTTSNC